MLIKKLIKLNIIDHIINKVLTMYKFLVILLTILTKSIILSKVVYICNNEPNSIIHNIASSRGVNICYVTYNYHHCIKYLFEETNKIISKFTVNMKPNIEHSCTSMMDSLSEYGPKIIIPIGFKVICNYTNYDNQFSCEYNHLHCLNQLSWSKNDNYSGSSNFMVLELNIKN